MFDIYNVQKPDTINFTRKATMKLSPMQAYIIHQIWDAQPHRQSYLEFRREVIFLPTRSVLVLTPLEDFDVSPDGFVQTVTTH